MLARKRVLLLCRCMMAVRLTGPSPTHVDLSMFMAAQSVMQSLRSRYNHICQDLSCCLALFPARMVNRVNIAGTGSFGLPCHDATPGMGVCALPSQHVAVGAMHDQLLADSPPLSWVLIVRSLPWPCILCLCFNLSTDVTVLD